MKVYGDPPKHVEMGPHRELAVKVRYPGGGRVTVRLETDSSDERIREMVKGQGGVVEGIQEARTDAETSEGEPTATQRRKVGRKHVR